MSVNNKIKEYSLFGLIVFLLFILRAYNENEEVFRWDESVFLLNNVWAAILISYVFLPVFFYKKKFRQFSVYSLIVLIVSFLLEEFFIEQIFYPETRAIDFNLISIVKPMTNILLFVGYKFAWDALQKEKKIATLNVLLAESQLQHLKSQINPHFLFNNLNNLYSYSLESSDKTSEIILKLSSLLRYMLYECNDNMVALRGEIETLENYIELCNIQLEERGLITFNYDEFAANTSIAPLIYIVFVENAFKHASSSQTKNIKISVSISNEEEFIAFYCTNNFQNISNNSGLEHGIGLKNVEERLKICYGNNYKLQTNIKDGIFSVSLKLPK
ncbi:sensor histidine kinase [Carboxylicivirga sp. N1Y90]|uniref:sensor histidine kinase n=1 Tax=Carboxylicivirga fragile TaxID=3417571 RepID=UPI003D3412E4|nr:histidine kinase [Marinilabiliaceae bacterium N1Y90]